MPCFTCRLARPFITGETALSVGSGAHQTRRPRGISLTEVPPEPCRGHTLAGVPDGDEATPGALQSCIHMQPVLALQDRRVSGVSACLVPKWHLRADLANKRGGTWRQVQNVPQGLRNIWLQQKSGHWYLQRQERCVLRFQTLELSKVCP